MDHEQLELEGQAESLAKLLAAFPALRIENEQLRYQLAHCQAAANGRIALCKGDYGWSEAYEAIRELQKKIKDQSQ